MVDSAACKGNRRPLYSISYLMNFMFFIKCGMNYTIVVYLRDHNAEIKLKTCIAIANTEVERFNVQRLGR